MSPSGFSKDSKRKRVRKDSRYLAYGMKEKKAYEYLLSHNSKEALKLYLEIDYSDY